MSLEFLLGCCNTRLLLAASHPATSECSASSLRLHSYSSFSSAKFLPLSCSVLWMQKVFLFSFINGRSKEQVLLPEVWEDCSECLGLLFLLLLLKRLLILWSWLLRIIFLLLLLSWRDHLLLFLLSFSSFCSSFVIVEITSFSSFVIVEIIAYFFFFLFFCNCGDDFYFFFLFFFFLFFFNYGDTSCTSSFPSVQHVVMLKLLDLRGFIIISSVAAVIHFLPSYLTHSSFVCLPSYYSATLLSLFGFLFHLCPT